MRSSIRLSFHSRSYSLPGKGSGYISILSGSSPPTSTSPGAKAGTPRCPSGEKGLKPELKKRKLESQTTRRSNLRNLKSRPTKTNWAHPVGVLRITQRAIHWLARKVGTKSRKRPKVYVASTPSTGRKGRDRELSQGAVPQKNARNYRCPLFNPTPAGSISPLAVRN